MNPSDLASLISSVNSGGGAANLMQGSPRGRVFPGLSNQPGTSLLDAFAQQPPDSRPNTAPAGTRPTGTATATATGGTTSASVSRTAGSSSKPRNGGTSSTTSATAPTSGASSGTAGGPKGGAIQMSALSNILANLSGSSTTQEAGGEAASKPAIDLYDIMTNEVNLITWIFDSFLSFVFLIEFNTNIK
jgi:hypothetical protein